MARDRSTPRSPSALDSIVLAPGRGFELRAGCPGYVDPLAAALKRAVPSDSLGYSRSYPLAAARPGSHLANSLLGCASNERPPSKPHSPVNHAVHAGGCRRRDRLGHRGRTDRSPAAGASARITEMTSGCRRGGFEPLASCCEARLETMHFSLAFSFCRWLSVPAGLRRGRERAQDLRSAFGANRKTFARFET